MEPFLIVSKDQRTNNNPPCKSPMLCLPMHPFTTLSHYFHLCLWQTTVYLHGQKMSLASKFNHMLYFWHFHKLMMLGFWGVNHTFECVLCLAAVLNFFWPVIANCDPSSNCQRLNWTEDFILLDCVIWSSKIMKYLSIKRN